MPQSDALDGSNPTTPTPLAARLRPTKWQEVVGQEKLLGEGGALRGIFSGGALPSLVLIGPPGTGKTTLAHLLAASRQAHFIALSAVSAGVAAIRSAVVEAEEKREQGQATVLFLDEIHHFNKSQQDALLPYVEDGLLTLIGATTENPSFQLNSALLSRVQVFELEPLNNVALAKLLSRALKDKEYGLGKLNLTATKEAKELLIARSGGDARIMLGALEQAAGYASTGATLAIAAIEQVLSSPILRHDRAGDLHYQLLSAFIKSMRGSDPDAAVYWLARLLEAGEDPLVPARRMVILAAEDVGLAQPRALEMAVAAHSAARLLGMPECRLPLAEVAIFLAVSPKSNSTTKAIAAATEDVKTHLNLPVPIHLRNAVTTRDYKLGYGKDYQYAHNQPDALVSHHHLPDKLKGKQYYQPTLYGLEAEMAKRLQKIRARQVS